MPAGTCVPEHVSNHIPIDPSYAFGTETTPRSEVYGQTVLKRPACVFRKKLDSLSACNNVKAGNLLCPWT